MAAAQQLFERFGSELKCPICMEVMTEPSRLPCCHYFCRGCLVSAFKQSEKEQCPMCKKPSNRRDITLDPKMALLAAAFAKFETATKDKPSQPAAVGVEQTAAVVAAPAAGRRSQQQQKRGINLPPGKGGPQAKPPAEAACDNAVAADAGLPNRATSTPGASKLPRGPSKRQDAGTAAAAAASGFKKPRRAAAATAAAGEAATGTGAEADAAAEVDATGTSAAGQAAGQGLDSRVPVQVAQGLAGGVKGRKRGTSGNGTARCAAKGDVSDSDEQSDAAEEEEGHQQQQQQGRGKRQRQPPQALPVPAAAAVARKAAGDSRPSRAPALGSRGRRCVSKSATPEPQAAGEAPTAAGAAATPVVGVTAVAVGLAAGVSPSPGLDAGGASGQGVGAGKGDPSPAPGAGGPASERRIPGRLLPWTCDMCTLINLAAAKKCVACRSKRGADSGEQVQQRQRQLLDGPPEQLQGQVRGSGGGARAVQASPAPLPGSTGGRSGSGSAAKRRLSALQPTPAPTGPGALEGRQSAKVRAGAAEASAATAGAGNGPAGGAAPPPVAATKRARPSTGGAAVVSTPLAGARGRQAAAGAEAEPRTAPPAARGAGGRAAVRVGAGAGQGGAQLSTPGSSLVFTATAFPPTSNARGWLGAGSNHWRLVGSGLDDGERALIKRLCRLSGAVLLDKWPAAGTSAGVGAGAGATTPGVGLGAAAGRVTHVVCGTDENCHARRTIKYLMGLVHGCQVVDVRWVRDCLEQGGAMCETPYQVAGDQAGGRGGAAAAVERAAADAAPLLRGWRVALAGPFASRDELTALVKAAGASVVSVAGAMSGQGDDGSARKPRERRRGGGGAARGRGSDAGASCDGEEGTPAEGAAGAGDTAVVLVDAEAVAEGQAARRGGGGHQALPAPGSTVVSHKWLLDTLGSMSMRSTAEYEMVL